MTTSPHHRRLWRSVGQLMLAMAAVLGSQAIGAAELGVSPDAESRAAGVRLQRLPAPATHYLEHCSGCHGREGKSVTEMPTLVGRIGYFTRSAEGRAYLGQVPGVALSALNDQDLAALLNWVLKTYSGPQLAADFKPYSADEVGALRKMRINPWARRQELVQQLVANGQIPSAQSLALDPSKLY